MAYTQHSSASRKPKVSNKDQLSPRQAKKLKRADRMIQEGESLTQAERLLADIEQRLRPPYPLLQVQGALQFARKRYVEAQKIYKAVWQRNKRNPVAYYYLGKIYRKLNEPEVGRGLLETGVLLNPEHQPTQIEFIKTLLDLAELDKAEQYVEKQRVLLPSNPDILQLAGEVKRRNKLLPEAVEFFRQALAELIKLPPRRDTSAADAEATFDVERHEDTLWQLLAHLKQEGVHAFPIAGTLLGLVRDGQLLPFDKDVDICVPEAQLDATVAHMQAAGWKEIAHSFGMSIPRAFTHPEKRLAVDVFALCDAPDGDQWVTGFIMPDIPFEWNYLLRFPDPELVAKPSPHGEVWDVENAEAYLEALYGQGWKQPDPHFATFGGEPNLVSFSHLTQCYAYIRLRKYWAKGSFKKMDALLYHMLRHQPDDELLLTAKARVEECLAIEMTLQEQSVSTIH